MINMDLHKFKSTFYIKRFICYIEVKALHYTKLIHVKILLSIF